MPKYFIYPIYTLVLFLIVLAVVPRKKIQTFSFYAIFFGAIVEIALIFLLTKVIGVGGYKNFGPFGFLGVPFFPPIAWVAFFILFLYFLPKKRPWNYIYIFAAAGYGVLFSNVLKNLGIFSWNMGEIVIPYILYLSWFSFFAWAYYKLTNNLQQQIISEEHTSLKLKGKATNIRTPRLRTIFFTKIKLK